MHSEHSFVVTGDAGFQVPLHVDLALVEHLYGEIRGYSCDKGCRNVRLRVLLTRLRLQSRFGGQITCSCECFVPQKGTAGVLKRINPLDVEDGG